MCIIVDANVAHRIVAAPMHEDARQIVDWIDRGDGRLVIGGKLTEELSQNGSVTRWLRTRIQAGLVRQIPVVVIAAKERHLSALKVCLSDDVHVLALALASGCRLIYTADGLLRRDFKNKRIIGSPRGKVYTSMANKNLLNSRTCRPR